MNTRKVAEQYRLNKWTEIIRECRSSGQTISTWCAGHGINPSSYYYWLKKVREAASEALPSVGSQANPIVPVNISLPTAETTFADKEISSDIVIHFGPVTLEIRNHASASLIENTLRAIQHVR